MSQPPRPKAGADEPDVAAARRIFPRPFHAGPNPVADVDDAQERKEAAESGAAPTEPAVDNVAAPVRRLDVSLRCVFGWLQLINLHHALSVSKQWHANVSAMPSIGARVTCLDKRPLCVVWASPLARHVGDLCILSSSVASASDLAMVCARMGALRKLHVYLAMPVVAIGPGVLCFPKALKELELTLSWPGASGDTPRLLLIQRVIDRIGALASLERLELRLCLGEDQLRDTVTVSFEPLRALHHLHMLFFAWLINSEDEQEEQTLTAVQLDALRYLANEHALRGLCQFAGRIACLLDDMAERNETKPLLVHELIMDGFTFTADHVPMLRCFPQLRSFEPYRLEVLDFLPSMTHLQTLKVSLPQGSVVTPEQLIDAIVPLVQLTDLTIEHHPTLNEVDLTRMLAPLSLLHTLDLDTLPQLRSLSFLADGPITLSLTSLSLYHCRHTDLHSAELLHLHACKRLTEMTMITSFSDQLSEFARRLYTQRPCSVLPALQDFYYE